MLKYIPPQTEFKKKKKKMRGLGEEYCKICNCHLFGLLWYLSPVFYSFQHIDFAHILGNSYISISYSFGAIVNSTA